MTRTHKLKKVKAKKNSMRKRKGGRLFGLPSNPVKGFLNSTGFRKSRDQITKENLMVGMSPFRNYNAVVEKQLLPFQQQVNKLDEMINITVAKLSKLVKDCTRESIVVTEEKYPDQTINTKSMFERNPLTFCEVFSAPPYQIKVCEDVVENKKIVEAYLNVLEILVKKHKDNLAALSKSSSQEQKTGEELNNNSENDLDIENSSQYSDSDLSIEQSSQTSQ